MRLRLEWCSQVPAANPQQAVVTATALVAAPLAVLLLNIRAGTMACTNDRHSITYVMGDSVKQVELAD